MKKRDVEEMDGCKYIEVNDDGLVIERGEGKRRTLEVSQRLRGLLDSAQHYCVTATFLCIFVITQSPLPRRLTQVDTVVICAGQECFAKLFEPVKKAGGRVFLIGGAQEAGELDGP